MSAVVSPGRLYLEDLRPQVAQQHGAVRSGENTGEIEDGNPLEG